MKAKKFLTQLKFSIKYQIITQYQQLLQKYYYKIPVQSQTDQQNIEKSSVKHSYVFPFYTYPEYNHHFQQYCTWENFKEDRPVTHYDTISNLLFVIGTENCGKSSFINYNLKTLEIEYKNKMLKLNSSLPNKQNKGQIYNLEANEQSEPLIMQYDLKNNGGIINFKTFLHHLETLLYDSIIKRSKYLDSQIIMKILLQQYDKKYLNLFLKDSVYGILNNMDARINTNDQEVLEFLSADIYFNLLDGEIQFEEAFTKISEKLNPNNQVEGALNLAMSMLYRIEHEYRQKAEQYERTGIQTTDFLLDVINFLTGFHTLNNIRICDCVLVFNNFEKIFLHYKEDERIWNLFDHIVLRLYTNENQRTHFPIIIETQQKGQVTREILSLMHKNYTSFPYIELTGFLPEDLQSSVGHIYQKDSLNKIQQAVGLNIGDWKKICQMTLQQKDGFQNALDLDGEAWQKEYSQFCAKINKSILDTQVSQYLDNDEIDFMILDVLQIMWNFDGLVWIGHWNNEQFFVNNPVVKSFLESGLMYDRYYYPYLQFQRRIYIYFCEKWLNQKLKSMSLYQRFQYRRWRKKNGIDYSNLQVKIGSSHIFYPQNINPKDGGNFEMYSYYEPTRPHQHYMDSNRWYLNLV